MLLERVGDYILPLWGHEMKDEALVEQYRTLLTKMGVTINGPKPYDIKVLNTAVYKRILKQGSLGVGESYMDGWWTCKDLEEFFFRLFKTRLQGQFVRNWRVIAWASLGLLTNLQASGRAYKNARSHYDIGNDIYEPMLGPSMAYSCGYWARGAKNLDQAQEAKYQLICEKLELKKGLTVLDIGAGWGGLAQYMAANYGASVMALTPAREQVAFMKELKNEKIKPICSTYQDFQPGKKFDRIVSVGMFEHVGPKNYKNFFQHCNQWLKDDGLFLLHTITGPTPAVRSDPWIEKYIFPGGVLPSVSQMCKRAEKLFTIEDLQNFGPDYHKTLMAWYKNFKKAYPKLDHTKYDQRFYRMWEFYLLVCAAQFRARKIFLTQTVMTKQRPGTYVAAR